MKAAIIGSGAAPAWAARFAVMGWDVAVVGPGEGLERACAAARHQLAALSDGPMPPEGAIAVTDDIAQALAGAEHLHICPDGDLQAARRMIAAAQAAAPGLAVALELADLAAAQDGARHPGAIFGVSGSAPEYLLPLVELSVTDRTDSPVVQAAEQRLRGLGLAVQRLPPGVAAVAPRLEAALRQAAEAMLAEGLAPGQIAATLAAGPALRWALGNLWGHPDDDGAQAAALSGVLRALKDRGHAAGAALRAQEAARRPERAEAGEQQAAPLVCARLTVLPAWIDGNGHMTESRYLFACSEATDAFLRLIGVDWDYIAAGHSYYSVETHILHLGECKLGDALVCTVQVIAADAKRLHLVTTVARADGTPAARLEQMLLHVDMVAGRACPAPDLVLDRLLPIARAHAALAPPPGLGRHVGAGRG